MKQMVKSRAGWALWAMVVSMAMEQTVEADSFDWAFYRKAGGEGASVFVSPLSVKQAFGLAALGASGETHKEMVKVLGLPGDVDAAAAALAAQREAAGQSGGGIELRMANTVWVQDSFKLLPDYLKRAERAGARPRTADFASKPEAAERAINGWASTETRGRIDEIIPSGYFRANPLTRVVLANAVYFKGAWQKPFDPKSTRKMTFHGRPKREVPMMFQRGKFRYAEVDGLQILEMPYGKAGDLVMTVLLPGEGVSMKGAESKFTEGWANGAFAKLAEREVEVFFPRFKVESSLRLKGTLSAMGMGTAFSARGASFERMRAEDDLFIAEGFHKTFVEVTEEGTEAAAVTAAVMATRSAMRGPTQFKADRPFAFAIRNRGTGAILFVGRMM